LEFFKDKYWSFLKTILGSVSFMSGNLTTAINTSLNKVKHIKYCYSILEKQNIPDEK